MPASSKAKIVSGAGIVYRFGPFELNATSGELLRQGSPLKLQDQPFRLLLVLLERAGELVSHEELHRRLWDGTFVEFDGSLRVAVRKVREALHEDADLPHYIETVPRKGYRFLAPVIRVEGPVSNMGGADFNKPSIQNRWVPARTSAIALAAGAAAFAIAFFSYFYFSRPSPALTGKDTIVLAEFANKTADPIFDDTLRQGLAVQLEQSPFLSLVSEDSVRRSLHLMGRPAGARLTPELAREVCVRTGSAAALSGSIAPFGKTYILSLRAQNCRNGNFIEDVQARAAGKQDVLNALDSIARRFREWAGESRASLAAHNAPLASATTPSLGALQAYSLGWKVNAAKGEAAALPFFRRAVELDPQFASAYAAMALMYSANGETAGAVRFAAKAYGLRGRVSDSEKYFIAAFYEAHAIGNQEKARQICQAWAEAYPRDSAPHAFLAGFILPISGKYEEVIREAGKAVRLDPDSAIGYVLLAYGYAYEGRQAQAAKVRKIAFERKLDNPLFAVMDYDAAFLNGSVPAMQRAAASTHQRAYAEDWIFDRQAFALAYAGRLRAAEAMLRRAADLARQEGFEERAAVFQVPGAIWEALFGKTEAARSSATKGLAIASDREIAYGAAFALAASGSTRSLEIADELRADYPEDTSVQFSYLPVLRALRALNRGDPRSAIATLEKASPYDVAMPRSALQGFFGALYPIYVRGEAYLAARDGQRAAAEFQKIVRHRGIVISDPIGALAHLQLGRSYALSGDATKAKAAYRTFLALWKNADSDIPILREAKAEYSRL